MAANIKLWWACAAAVALLAILPYLNGLASGFAYDDVALVAHNPRVQSLSSLGETFTTDWWNGTRPHSLAYRPLTMASFALDHAVARDGKAWPFHAHNVAWHAAASVVLFLLVWELFTSLPLALATAALFAVHPIHTEAVDQIVGRAELMSACFAFASLIVAWRALRDSDRGLTRPLLSAVFLFLALLGKEIAIVIPAVPLYWAWTGPRKPGVRKLLACLAVAVVVYLAMRTSVLGSPVAAFPSTPGTVVTDNPIAGAAGAARVLTPIRVFGHAAALLLFPKTLSADYSYDQIPLVHALDAATTASALLLIVLLVAAYGLSVRAPAASFGIFLFLLAFSLTSNLAVVIGTIFGERLLYLPSAGACLAIASGIVEAGTRFRIGRWAAVALAAIVVAAGVRTWSRNPDWKDNLTLFARTAAASPRSCKALDGYAGALLTAGRPEEAKVWSERALAIYPSYAGALQTHGKSLRVLANEERDPARREELRSQAERNAAQLVSMFASAPVGGNGLADAWSLSGGLALDRGDAGAALAAFEKSLTAQPAFVPSLIGAGVALSRQADREADPGRRESLRAAALARFTRALALEPSNAEARRNLTIVQPQDPTGAANLHGLRGKELLRDRRFVEALAEFREAARLQPDVARAYLGAGTALSAQADEESDTARKEALVGEAIRAFLQALSVEPDNADAHMNLGITYLNQRRDPAKVAEHFRAYLRLVPDAPQRARLEETIRQMDMERR